MKKHLLAIFTYFVTFFISVFLVGLLVSKTAPLAVSAPCVKEKKAAKSFNPVSENADQINIRTVLESDKKFGSEYFAGSQNAEDTKNLVYKMQTLNRTNLPLPFRKAYKAHIAAWNNYARHLERSSGNHDFSDRDCRILNREINETYNTVLLSAKSHGVDF